VTEPTKQSCTRSLGKPMSLFDSVYKLGSPSDHDLAVLADWAEGMIVGGANPDWVRAYRMLYRGADLLLRRKARSTVNFDVPKETK